MKALNDYSHIHGFNYTPSYGNREKPWLEFYDHEVIDREMGYAQRLGLNSARIFLPYAAYLKDPKKFLDNLKDYVQTAWAHGVSTNPILFTGWMFFPHLNDTKPASGDPPIISMVKTGDYTEGEKFADDLIKTIGNEPGLLFWDIANEPGYRTPNFVVYAPTEPQFRRDLVRNEPDMVWFKERQELVWKFIRHFCKYMKDKDPGNAIGVGNTFSYEIEPSGTGELVDILVFHDYFETRKRVRDICDEMKALSKKYNKPVINNETCCLCRANPYDMAIEIHNEYKFGWYAFELMIGVNGWNRVHGIVYPDGTVRDPSIVAAVNGFFRNRGESALRPHVNQEGHAYLAIDLAKKAIANASNSGRGGDRSQETGEMLEAAEYIANLLEAGEHVPMDYPPTARLAAYRDQEKINADELKDWIWELIGTLKKACHIVDFGEEIHSLRV